MRIAPKIAPLPNGEWYFKDLPKNQVRECFHWELQRAVYFEKDNEADRKQVSSFRSRCKINKAGFFTPKKKGEVLLVAHDLALLPEAVWPQLAYQDMPKATLEAWRDLKRRLAVKEFTLDDEDEYRASLPHPGLGLYQVPFSRLLADVDILGEWKQWPLTAMFKEPWMRPRDGDDEKAVLSVTGGDLVILRIDFSQPDDRLKAQFAAWLKQVRCNAPVADVKKMTRSIQDRGGRPTVAHMRTCLKQLGVYRQSQHHGRQSAALNFSKTAAPAKYFPDDESDWSKDYVAAQALIEKHSIPKYNRATKKASRKGTG